MAQVKKTKKTTAKKAAKKTASSPRKAVKEVKKTVKAKSSVQSTVAGKLPMDKQQVIELFAQKAGDTGSPEVQVALLTHKIERLTEHLEINKKDNHSRRGLLKVIAKRRRILNYLQKLDEKRYKLLIDKLGLKK